MELYRYILEGYTIYLTKVKRIIKCFKTINPKDQLEYPNEIVRQTKELRNNIQIKPKN